MNETNTPESNVPENDSSNYAELFADLEELLQKIEQEEQDNVADIQSQVSETVSASQEIPELMDYVDALLPKLEAVLHAMIDNNIRDERRGKWRELMQRYSIAIDKRQEIEPSARKAELELLVRETMQFLQENSSLLSSSSEATPQG